MSTHTQPPQPSRPAPVDRTDWLEPLDESLAGLLHEYGVSVEALDAYTTRFRGVPIAEHFTKPRTNLILRRLTWKGSSTVYVDHDLDYCGPDHALTAALAGPCRDSWRRLDVPPIPGVPDEVCCKVLDLLGSPLAQRARAILDLPAPAGADAQPPLGRALAAAGTVLDPEELAAAYESSFRKETANRLAALITRPAAPCGAVLWGRTGCGRDHLLRAAAHLLLEAGEVTRVFRISAAHVSAGCVMPAEIDQALMRLLDDALDQPGGLLLFPNLDVCLTGTNVCAALLCDALDRGLRFLATFRSAAAVDWLQSDEALARRLTLVAVPAPDSADVAGALQRLAGTSAVTVSPAAVQTTLRLAHKHDAGEPAASLGLLGAALAEAAWQGSDQIGPDDIVAVQHFVWSEPTHKKE